MRHGELRTNLFHFDPAALPCAYSYTQSDNYRTAWSLLQDTWNRTQRFNLPTGCLVEMLSVISRGPVWINTNPAANPRVPAIVVLQPIAPDLVNQALHLWALDTLRAVGSVDTISADSLRVTAYTPLSVTQLLPEGTPVPGLAYEVVPWLVASAMAETPMSSSVPLPLQLTSDSGLLAWDNPIVAEYGQRRALALHGIRTNLVLIRGAHAPLIAVRVHLSHILTRWKYKTRSVWLRINGCITKLAVHTKRTDDGRYETSYSHPVERLLGHMGYSRFPKLGVDEGLAPLNDLRPIHSIIPSTPLIATGAGPLFLDQACWHLRRTVPGTEPVLAIRTVGALRKSTWSGADVSIGCAQAPREMGADVSAVSAPVLAVTAHSQTAVRLDLANRIISGADQQWTRMCIPALTLHHVRPAGADKLLCAPVSARRVESWFHDEIEPVVKSTGAKLAVVETSIDAVQGKAELDPKFHLRHLFAKIGVTTQFILNAEPAEIDYAANASILDLIRQAGLLRSPIRVRGLPAHTVAISIYLDRVKTKGSAVFLPVITRIRLESGRPEIFCNAPGTNICRWVDYHTGIANVHATRELMTAPDVRQFVSRALLAPTDIADTPLIVYCYSGLRTIFDGLRDGGGTEYPFIASNNVWLVRIRADEDVARMSGDNVRHLDAPGYIGERIGLYRSAYGSDVYYFVSPSPQYSRAISQRSNTRFDIVGRALRDPWQQLGVTEIAIIQRGCFASADEIAHQTALLCRNAPVWEGNLRLPAPMHLAKQVADDHPMIEIGRRLHANV